MIINNNTEFKLLDACRYVDDIRLVIQLNYNYCEKRIRNDITDWIDKKFNEYAEGLELNNEKTKIDILGNDNTFFVNQSHTAKRIQHEISGGFDMLRGTEIIGAIEGFFHTQKRYS
ncbi:hypothetical protein GF373_00725, partial [bacterium]|nr:hypothetical protein [bacterium]